jgi:hypothetical protein
MNYLLVFGKYVKWIIRFGNGCMLLIDQLDQITQPFKGAVITIG